MIALRRWAFLAVIVIVAGGTGGVALRVAMGLVGLLGQSRAGAQIHPSNPLYKGVLCGPISLATALGRLGVGKLPEDIATQCRVTSEGVAFTDLERVASETVGIRAQILNLNWDTLVRLDGVAVLFVNENHYLAVDPREAAPHGMENPLIRVYEPNRPAQWWTRSRLESIWNGYALTATRITDSDILRAGAIIKWEEAFVDHGVLRNSTTTQYQFSLGNVGMDELSIEGVQVSCGCMSYRVSQHRLAPGESAVLAVDVNLQGVEGYFQQHVMVRTNDMTMPVSMLKMAGGVPRSRVISSDIIRLEDLPQGGSLNKEFHIADPGFSGVVILEARFLLAEGSIHGDGLSCEISHNKIGADMQSVAATGGRVKASDHALRLSFLATPGCATGPFEGTVNVVLESSDRITTHQIAITGSVVPDIQPFPRVALVTVGADGIGSALIRLQSHAKRKFVVSKIRASEADFPLTIAAQQESRTTNDTYIITVRALDITPGTVPVKRTVVFEMNDGSLVYLPVMIVRPKT